MQDQGWDIENLFKEAAREVPLRDEDHWEEIQRRLKTPRSKKDRKIYLVLFFITAFLILSTYWLVYYPPRGTNIESLPAETIQVNVSDGTSESEKQAETTSNNDKEIVLNRIKEFAPGNISLKTPDVQKAFIFLDTDNTLSEGEITLAEHKELSGEEGQWIRRQKIKNIMNPDLSNNFIRRDMLKKGRSWELSEKSSRSKFIGKKFYMGLVAGAGINTVKHSSMSKAGVDFGLIGGYWINNRFSVETGLIYTKNFYEVAASSFNQKGIEPMLSGGRSLNEVHGSNKMIEVPLNLRFEIMRKNANSVYLSSGLSTYLVTRESNWYLTTMNGSSEMLYGTYNKTHPYFGAAMNLSAGFERKIGENSNLRIAPNVQLPLRGVGVGNIKLVNTGLHIGITKSVH